MEKLIELLNEYENMEIFEDELDVYHKRLLIISKEFWFIKWLVENDKINKHGIPEFYPVSDHCLECVYEWITDNTIMLLSIQKNPIDYLISLLK